MNIIAAVDKNWGIGRNNELLFNLPSDLKHFKEKTIGKVVVMGHNTFLSMPTQKPLEGRINVVLSHDKGLKIEGIDICHSIDELTCILKTYKSDDVFVIGGQAVYEELLNRCDTAYITKIDADGKAEIFLPNLDQRDEWVLFDTSDIIEDKGFLYTFNVYKKQYI